MPAPLSREGKSYKPGQTVPASGVYKVVHAEHREAHETLAVKGDEFPPCRTCLDRVRFHVVEEIPHVTHDFDLTGPRPESLKARAKAANQGDE